MGQIFVPMGHDDAWSFGKGCPVFWTLFVGLGQEDRLSYVVAASYHGRSLKREAAKHDTTGVLLLPVLLRGWA